MHHLKLGVVLSALTLIVACTGSEQAELSGSSSNPLLSLKPKKDLAQRWTGQSEFKSNAPFWDFFPMRTLEAASADRGASSRSVERADVIANDAANGLLYILNSYRGLQIVDVKNPADPQLISRTALGGWPIEMYRQDKYAFVLLNALADETQSNPADQGAVLRVYNVEKPAKPFVVTEFKVAGTIAGSRLLKADDGSSSVIYIASNVYSWQADAGSSETTYVMSVDVTNPAEPLAIDKVEFPGSGWQSHVTPKAMFIASYTWMEDETTVRYVDIADEKGDIEVRGDIELAGSLSWGERGELEMDHYNDHLRVASQVRGDFFAGTPSFIRISTIDTTKPDHMAVKGSLDVGEGHRLVAARFAQDKAYLFHMVQVDPLEVIDLADPAKPTSLGILKIDGWVNHIEVRGDKLVTIGVDDAVNRKLALILFDVSDPTNPKELSRATAGEKWAWTQASHDLRAFTLLDDLKVALLPVSSSSFEEGKGYSYKSWVQIFSVDLAAGKVQTRAQLEDVGGFKRALAIKDHIVTVSDQTLKSVELKNVDAPEVKKTLELARNVIDFATVGPFGVQVVGNGQYGGETVELRVVPLSDPDSDIVLATLDLGMPSGKLFKLDEQHLAYLSPDWVSGQTILAMVSLEDPFEPQLIKQMKLPMLGYFGWQTFGPAPVPDTVLVGDALAMFTWPTDGEEGGAKLRIIDLSNRAFPHESAVVELGSGTVVGMDVVGKKLYVSSYEPEPVVLEEGINPGAFLASSDVMDPESSRVAALPGSMIAPPFRPGSVIHDLRIIDLKKPSKPLVSPPINVPGRYLGEKKIGKGPFALTILYTMDRFNSDAGSMTSVDSLLLVGNYKARLLDLAALPNGTDRVFVSGDKAIFANTAWGFNPLMDVPQKPTFTIGAIDLAQPLFLSALPTQEITMAGWADLLGVFEDKALIQNGSKLTVYDLSNLSNLNLIGSFQTFGWWGGSIRTGENGNLYLPAGFYGLHTIDL